MARAIKVRFDIELEYGGKSVEYEVRAEVHPGSPGRGPSMSGPGEPPEGPDINFKEVWYLDKKVRCPEYNRAPRVHFMPFPRLVDGQPVTEDGRKCVKCQATGFVTKEFRRPELDDLISDEEVIENIPEPDEPDCDPDDG